MKRREAAGTWRPRTGKAFQLCFMDCKCDATDVYNH